MAPVGWRPALRQLMCMGRTILATVLCVCSLILCGCDKIASSLRATQVQARTADEFSEAFLTYRELLTGKSAQEVEEAFGQPKGVFERRNGATWMYDRWRVEFDAQGRVDTLEWDIATSKGSNQNAGQVTVLAQPSSLKAPSRSPSKGDGGHKAVTTISNDGERVNLQPVLKPGQVTVIDFYADWCGPCRRLSPQLEQLAGSNPDVVLVKIDIVRWGTPVTKQYNISSVPNVRVFDKSGNQIGKATSSFDQVKGYVQKAGG